MEFTCGITGNALSFFRSYLCHRKMTVDIRVVQSNEADLSFGVPQGSVLVPLLFNIYIYMTPLGDIIRHYGLRFHMYADETQIYYCFKPSNENYSNGCTILSDCISDIRRWMHRNFLKLNDDKTEILVIGSRLNPDVDLISLTIGLHAKCPVEYVRNLGVIFDKIFDFCRHVNNLVKCSF